MDQEGISDGIQAPTGFMILKGNRFVGEVGAGHNQHLKLILQQEIM